MFLALKKHFKQKWHYMIPFLLVVLVFYKQILHPFSVTFNLSDNWWYLLKSVFVRDLIFSQHSLAWLKPVMVPLYTYSFAMLGKFVSEVFLLNITYILQIILARFGSYKLFFKVSNNKNTSIIGATIFSFNTLTLYANRYNLMWLCWIPFLAFYLLEYKNNFWKIFMISILLFLSGHYYVLLWGIIYVSFIMYHIFYTKKLLSFISHTIAPFLCATLFSGLIYAIPYIINPDNITSTYNFSQLNKLEKEPVDLLTLITPQQFNPITKRYKWRLPPFDRPKHYSTYFGPIGILLFLLGLFITTRPKKQTIYVFYIMFFLSIIFFVGKKLTIWWVEILSVMPFSIFDTLWLSGVFRKSEYFFRLLSFAVWWIFSLSSLNIKSPYIVLCLSLFITLENTLSFNRSTHVYQELSYKNLHTDGNVLPLPNTDFGITKRRYMLHRKWFSSASYRDITIPYPDNYFDYIYKDCVLHKLTQPVTAKCVDDKNIFSSFKEKHITQVIVFKKHYVVDFYYDSGDSINAYYTDTIQQIRSYPNNFSLVEDNDDYAIYNVSYD